MKTHALVLTVAAAALLSLSACNKNSGNSTTAPSAQTPKAEEAAGSKTIASGLDKDSKFMAAAKAAGLDQTLAGPGPYTVVVPTDDAISGAPAGVPRQSG